MIFDIALAEIGLAPGQCLIVGDSLDSDIQGGKNAGISTALVLTGLTKPTDSIDKIRPDYVLDSIRNLRP